jgi:hypothetical protein
MTNPVNRRDFIRSSVLATTGLAAMVGLPAAAKAAADNPLSGRAPTLAKGSLPAGKIGKLQITRLILGGNLLTRYQHVRDLGYISKLVRSYNTDSKIRETIELAETNGINTLSVNITPSVCKILSDHRRNGGKIQWILYSTSDIEDFAHYRDDLRKMADDGAEAIYIWGVQADAYVVQGKLDVITKVFDEAKLLDVPCGIGAHDLRVVQEVEKRQLPVAFYIKTLHHHHYPSAPRAGENHGVTSEVPGHWCSNPDETIAAMKNVQKPWIAFKVMAAGAIPPKDAFAYAFDNGADFVLAGMFDFDIAEDCQITRDTVAHAQSRARAWQA